MIVLTATTDNVEIALADATVDFQMLAFASWRDVTTTTYAPGRTVTSTNDTTPVNIIPAPAASTQRVCDLLNVYNADSIAHVLSVRFDANGTDYILWEGSLSPGERVEYTDGNGFRVFAQHGAEKTAAQEQAVQNTWCVQVQKSGTVGEAAGRHYCWSKDAGLPGAWAVGTPGLAGRATDGTDAADAGCLPYVNAVTGENYLSGWECTSSQVHAVSLYDIIWVNSGIVVTTTTAQTINSVNWPFRDLYGTRDGHGVNVGILVTTTTTNGGAITGTTMSYTNQAGTAGQIATMVSPGFPATGVVGTVVWFELAAGDTGVRSIQEITLATSYGGGAISLIAAVLKATAPGVLINIAGTATIKPNPGVRLYDGSCLLPISLISVPTAAVISGSAYFTNQ